MQRAFDLIVERLEEETYDMEICEEQFDMNRPYFKDVPYKMVKIDDVKKIVNQVAEEYGDGWIPVSSGKLPEENAKVLITWTNHSQKKTHVDTASFSGNHFVTYDFEHLTVDAWQPLPESYKAESEG